MPADSILVAATVTLIFVVFAAVLAWGDSQTRTKQSARQGDARHRPF